MGAYVVSASAMLSIPIYLDLLHEAPKGLDSISQLILKRHSRKWLSAMLQ